jgi:ubiquinone/menaquinone biosynthesis C-methylase UbiE
MNRDELSSLAQIEESHWWFKERRQLLRLWALSFEPSSKFLDIGAGVGRQSLLLRDELGMQVTAIELSEFGVAACLDKNLNVIQVNATHLGLPSESFDAVIAMDVLEHIEEDGEVLNEIERVLKINGTTFITVPCFPFMWSGHDEAVGHVRRYTKSELVNKIERSGLSITSVRYWNSLLFPFAIISRFLFRNGADLKMPPALLNSFFFYVVSKERVGSFFGCLPGTSLLITAVKKAK